MFDSHWYTLDLHIFLLDYCTFNISYFFCFSTFAFLWPVCYIWIHRLNVKSFWTEITKYIADNMFDYIKHKERVHMFDLCHACISKNCCSYIFNRLSNVAIVIIMIFPILMYESEQGNEQGLLQIKPAEVSWVWGNCLNTSVTMYVADCHTYVVNLQLNR